MCGSTVSAGTERFTIIAFAMIHGNEMPRDCILEKRQWPEVSGGCSAEPRAVCGDLRLFLRSTPTVTRRRCTAAAFVVDLIRTAAPPRDLIARRAWPARFRKRVRPRQIPLPLTLEPTWARPWAGWEIPV